MGRERKGGGSEGRKEVMEREGREEERKEVRREGQEGGEGRP